MILKLWLCTASFLGPIVVVNSGCSPRYSGCQRNNNFYPNVKTVYHSSTVICSFVGSLCCYRQGYVDGCMGNWTTENGHASVRQTSAGCGADVYSVLESPWVNFSAPSCVEFTYSRYTPYQLQVVLVFNNGTPPSVMEDSTGVYENQNRTARFDIEHLTGQIQFRVRGGGGTGVSSPRLYYVRITEGRCPQRASPLHPEVSDPSSCDAHTTTEMTVGDGDSDSTVGVIVGASVAAVAAVVVFVIVLIAYRRKVHTRKPDGGQTNLAGRSTPAGADTPNLGPDDPYELAEDGAPGKTRNSLTDDYTYIGTGESSHQTYHQANGTLDYSCIGDTQNMATGAHGMNTAPAKPDPRDVYSVVNKPGKKTATPGNSLAQIVDDKPTLPNPNDEYSVVNKKGKKPDLVPKPGHSDTEYNTISHKANDNSSKKAAGDATLDTYNRIGGVTSLGSKGHSKESALAEKGSLVDEYNTLDFADTRQNASRKEKSGEARAAYDLVRNDPDDTYSKTQIGKRNVVIGSDYDHVKP